MEKFITTAFSFEDALECVMNGNFPACPWSQDPQLSEQPWLTHSFLEIFWEHLEKNLAKHGSVQRLGVVKSCSNPPIIPPPSLIYKRFSNFNVQRKHLGIKFSRSGVGLVISNRFQVMMRPGSRGPLKASLARISKGAGVG